MRSVRSLHDLLAVWSASHGVRAEVSVAELTIRSAPDERTIFLYEHAAHRLATLIELDIAARLGDRKLDADAADQLVLAALRAHHLYSVLQSHGDLNKPHPRALSRFWAALRRLHTAAATLAIRKTPALTDRLRLADAHDPLDAALTLAELQSIPAKSATQPPSPDAPTLADQFLLVICPGSYACVVHVRIYRPSERTPVVVFGELADYHSPGLIESPDQFLTELQHRIPLIADARPDWVHYLPSEYVAYSERQPVHLEPEAELPSTDSLRLVRLAPDHETAFRDLTFAELRTMIGGPMRRWHAANYTAATLSAWGIRTIDALNVESRSTHVERLVWLRCRRWLCGAAYSRPLRTLVTASCPRCGSTVMQPIRVERE